MPVRIFERLFVIFLCLSSMGIVDALTRPYLDARDPNIASTEIPFSTAIIESAVYFCGALLILVHWRAVFRAARAAWPLVGLALLSLLSIVWSVQPSLTLRRSIALLASTLFGIYLGERFSTEQLARLLAQAICIMILAVLIFYFVAPGYVIDSSSDSGDWRGLSVSKNSFGGYMAIGVLTLLLVNFRHIRWLRYAFLLAAAILLLLSGSATSLVGCVLIVSIMPLWRLTRAGAKTRRVAYAVLALAICTGIYLICIDPTPLFRVLGRDSTLTGRTDIWSLVVSAIDKHPILGYGYGAFWSESTGEVLDIYIASKWVPLGAHNGYLDLCLSLGLLGLPLMFYALLRSFRMAKDYIQTDDGWLSIWPMSYLLLFIFHNFLESHLLETRSLEYLMFVAVTTSLALELSPQRVIFPVRESPWLAAPPSSRMR